MTDFEGYRPGDPAYRSVVAGLFLAGIATFAQLYSPQAVLPFLARDLGVTPATAALAVSAATLGLAITVVPWSAAADRFGRRATMSTGIIAATVIGLAAPFAPSIEIFLVARLAEGAALGAVPAIALAYLGDEVSASHAARAAGSYVAGTTVGGLAGRLISGPFAEWGQWRIGILAVAVVCALCAVLFLRVTPVARGFVRSPGSLTAVAERIGANLRSPSQLVLYAHAFLLMGCFVAVYNYLGFALSAAPFLVPLWGVSLIFLAYLGGTLSSPWAGALASRFGRLPVLLGSIATMIAGILITLVPAVPAIVAGLVVFTAGFFAVHAVASGWAPSSAAPGSAAQASSLYYLAYYAGSSGIGWALGLVFTAIGWHGIVAAVWASGVICAVLAARVLRRTHPS